MTNCFNALSHGLTTFPYVFHKALKYINLCSLSSRFYLVFFVVIVHVLINDYLFFLL